MSCNSNTPNINKTFIIEPLSLTGGSPTLSACTSLYTNLIQSCSGDTTITMGTGVVTFNSNVNGINSFTANTIEANTYLSGGTNILDIVNGNDTFVTGGTFNDVSDTLTLVRNDGASVVIGGLANYYVTGGTYNNNTGLITFDRNDTLSAFTVDLSTIDVNDTFVTGGTLVNTDLILNLNDGSSASPIDLSGLEFTGNTSATCISDIYVSNIHSCSPLYINPNNEGNIYFGSTSGVTIDVLSGGVVANTLGGDGTEIFNVPITGVTNLQTELDNKTDLTLFNSHTGDTNNPHSTSFSNLTSTAHTHSIGDVINLQTELDSKLDITTFNTYSGNVETELNTKISGATNLSSEGVFAQKNGLDLEFKGITSTGGTVNISSNSNSVNLEVTAVGSDKFVSGGTYNGGTKEINFVGNSVDTTFNVDLTSLVNSVTGDTFVTGFTWNPTTFDLTIEQNNGITDETVNLSVLATDVYVISGVYNPATGIVTYTNSSGGTFQVSGFTTGMTDSYTTAANLNGETIEFDNNIQGSNLYNVSLSPVLSGKTDLTLFNTHTGDTNNPHQTSFSNLTATAHTHSISEVINLQTELDSKTNNTDFISHTGDTTIHFTKSSINLSDLGSSAHTHTLSEITDFNSYSGNVQTQIDNKTDLTLFNSHTGDTNNPHQTSFGNLSSTAHTHTLSEITDFNTYSGNVQTQLDTKVEDGVNSGGANEVFSGKSGTDLYFRTISGGSNTTVTTVGDIIKIDATGGGGGGEANTASNVGVGIDFFKQKVGVNLEFRTLSGGTYTQLIQGTSTNLLNITGLTSNTDFISHTGDTTIHFTKGDINLSDLGSTAHTHSISEVINLQTELDNKTDLTLFNTHTGDTNNPHQTSFSNLSSTAHTHTISDVTNLQSELDSKLNISDFNVYSGNVETQIGSKTDLTLFNSHTGDTNNPHQTSFSNLSSTAHTHTLSDITDFNSYSGDVQTQIDGKLNITDFNTYSGNVQTQLDTKIENGINSGGANEVFSGKSGTDLYFRTLSGGSNTTISTINDIIKVDVSVPVDTNTFVTGGTYNPTTDVITLTRNDAVTIDITGVTDTFTTGATYDNGTATATFTKNDGTTYTLDLSTIDVNDTFSTGGTVTQNSTNNNPNQTIQIVGNDGFSSYNITGVTDTFTSGFTYNNANTFTISRNDGVNLTASINDVTGLTVNGTLIVDTISATTINGSVSGLTLNDLDDVTTGIPTTPDNTYQGRQIYFDVTTNQWLSTEEYATLGTVTIWGKKGTAGTISKGLPVYITGFDTDIHDVELANASTGTTMPVIGFTGEDFDNAGVYPLITFGKLTGVNTTSGTTTLNPNGETWEVNDELYMSTTTGGLTKFRPTGTNTKIQRIAKVLKVGTTDGQLFIFNTARTAGLPNLTSDYLWVGNGNDTPQEVIRTDVGITTTGFTYNDNNTFTITDDNGGSFSATINQVSGLTVNGNIEMGNTSTRQIFSTGVSEISSIQYATSGTSIQMRWDGSGDSTVLSVNNTDFATLSSTKTSFGGLSYGADYSPYYTDRSLIDLGYFNSIISGKTDLTLFNSHTGDTNNPHNTSFSNLTSTAHTHTISDITNLQTELDSKIETASNVGGAIEVFSGKSGTDLKFRTISGGTNTTVSLNGDTIVIDSTGGGSGEVNTASNLGGGTGLFAQKNGVDLEFKSLTSTGGTVTITNNSTTVNIESTGGGTGVSDANKIFSWFMTV